MGKSFILLLIALLLTAIILTVSCGNNIESKTTTTELITTTAQTTPTTTPTPTVTDTQTTTPTTTTPTPTTVTATTTPVPTATNTQTTTTTTNNEPAICSVIDIILPPSAPYGEYFTISLIVTNIGDNQVNCDIPINVTDLNIPTNMAKYVISVTLAAGETKEFFYKQANLSEGSYTVVAGDISKYLFVT